MSYATDFYKTTDNGELEYICSVSGSDAPSHFENVKTLKDVDEVLSKISKEGTKVWYEWPVPWEDSKTSDDCVIFELIERKWWEFWKPKDAVKFWIGVWYEKYGTLKGTRKMYFTDIPLSEHYNMKDEEEWKVDDLKIFELPQMRIKS